MRSLPTPLLCLVFLGSAPGAEAVHGDDEVLRLFTTSFPAIALRDGLTVMMDPKGPTLLKTASIARPDVTRVFRLSVPVTTPNTQIQTLIYDVSIGSDAFGGPTVEASLNVLETGILIAAANAADPNRQVRMEVATGLKSGLFPAEVQYQSGAYEDANANGIGDFCHDLGLLDGTRNTAEGVTLSLLPPKYQERLASLGCTSTLLTENEIGFWCFIVLPKGLETVAIDTSGTVRILPGKVAPADASEAKKAIAAGKLFRR